MPNFELKRTNTAFENFNKTSFIGQRSSASRNNLMTTQTY